MTKRTGNRPGQGRQPTIAPAGQVARITARISEQQRAEYVRRGASQALRDWLDSCPLCGDGRLATRTERQETEYRGKQGTVTLRYAECDACGSEITGDADGRANKRAVLAFRKLAEDDKEPPVAHNASSDTTKGD